MLKRHILKTFDDTTRKGVTECGEPFSRNLRFCYGSDEYDAVRRIGGLVAVCETEFYPDRHACKKCEKLWNNA